jgi:hypothetical protein
VTTKEDEAELRRSDAFRRLERLIAVRFLRLERAEAHKYERMSRGHRAALRHAAGRGYCVFLAPDALVSDGALRRLDELAAGGRRVVAGFGPPVVQETIARELGALPGRREGEPLVLEPRRIVEIAMRHLHADTLAHFADCPTFPEKPYACIWPGPGGDGMLVRALSLHPYLFDARPIAEDDELANLTIDWALIPRFVADWNEFYVETDSDGFSVWGMGPQAVRAKPPHPNRLDPEKLSLWLLRNNYAFVNRASFAYPVRFHAGPLDAAWEALVRRTQEFALDVIDPNRALRHWTLFGYSLGRGGDARPAEETRMSTGNLTLDRDSAAVSPAGADEPVPFFYAFAIWGEAYVDYLGRYAIPSMLAPNNLPALPNLRQSAFVIATTPEDEERIRALPIFPVLERLIEVKFLYLPPPDPAGNKYHRLAQGHRMATELAMGRGCAVYLGPDGIYPDGMFAALWRRLQEGKKAVVGLGPRVNEETLVEELVASGRLAAGEPLIVAPREAAALLARHLHEDARRMRWTSPHFPQTPYMCVWEMWGGEGMLIRPFSLHAYYVDYRGPPGVRLQPHTDSVVDASFVIDCLIPWDEIHQVTDSDEFMVLSVTPTRQSDFANVPNSDVVGTLIRWSQHFDKTILHRAYFMRALKVHTGDLDERWVKLERETLKIAYDILGPRPPGTVRLPHETYPPFADQLNSVLAGDLAGVSGRLALRVLLRKVWSRVRSLWRRRGAA